jgi:signal transduction histidine kinase
LQKCFINNGPVSRTDAAHISGGQSVIRSKNAELTHGFRVPEVIRSSRMGAPSSAGQGPPRRGRSIGSYFATRLAVPAVCLVLVWVAVAVAVFVGALRHVVHPSAHRALIEAVVVAGAGLVVALAVIVLIWAFVRQLTREAATLAATAGRLADEQLPTAVARLRDGAREPEAGTQPTTVQPTTGQPARIAEFAAVTAALASMQATATTAAASEARLRGGFRQVLTSLGRRNQSLLLRQLRILDTLEQQAASPAALADLFALDHLTTRMRRHAESLTVLSGAPQARPRIGPVSVIDVIRAAVAETEDYKRVVVRTETEEVVAASAVNDVIHLLAELIENATLFSPSATRVEVRAERVANGFAIEVEDRGLGIAPDQLSDLNARLASPPDFDIVDADRLGLFVAGLLAARHGIEVSLTPSPYRGTKAIVLLPDELVLPGTDADGPAGAARLRSTNALSLVGVAASPALPEPRQGEADAAGQPGTTFHGLPRRVRPDKQAQPADQDRPAAHSREAAPTDAPAPDDARRLAASLQRSWHRSRADDESGDDTADADAADAGAPEDVGRGGWAPDNEEENRHGW